MKTDLFKGRKLVIATKHQKERVIAPIIEKHLGVHCFIDRKFDTDSLGTFTGEIERTLDPIANAKEKCLMAMKLNNCDLGIANEGSFGAHPSIFFAAADEEIMVFIDQKNGLEIIEKKLSTDTNFTAKEIVNETELMSFAAAIGFPEHGLILRASEHDVSKIRKDLATYEELKAGFESLLVGRKSIFAETDMRAMNNPKRMEVIRQLTHALLKKIDSTCPNCSIPGFGIKEVIRGLKCDACQAPTRSTLSFIYQCEHCGYRKEEEFPHNKKTEDPMYCDYCNP